VTGAGHDRRPGQGERARSAKRRKPGKADPGTVSIALGPLRVYGSTERQPPDLRPGCRVEELGNMGSGLLDVYIDRSVWEAILQHCRSDRRRELCGVLLGHYCHSSSGHGARGQDKPRLFLEIGGSIPAQFTRGRSASVTFTHRSWQAILSSLPEQGDETIVGWYHTHPGFGIFLSGHDRFIHENFFDLPWQVALVVDPIGSNEGFFYWSNGKIERAVGYGLVKRET